MPTTRRIASPTGGRSVANPQDMAVYHDDEQGCILLQFDDFNDGRPVEWRATPQLARHIACLIIMGCAKINGRFVESDDFGFTVTDAPIVEPLGEPATEGNEG